MSRIRQTQPQSPAGTAEADPLLASLSDALAALPQLSDQEDEVQASHILSCFASLGLTLGVSAGVADALHPGPCSYLSKPRVSSRAFAIPGMSNRYRDCGVEEPVE